jgi:protoporphyrinogen oxidase
VDLHPARTLVVGGGLAGLSCARELGGACALFEAEERLGGLCRTDSVGGYLFDWTGHWLHARDPQMRALIEERWLRGNLLTVERSARIHSQGCWTRFPYQHHLHGLPAQTIADCLEGFVEAQGGEEGRALRERELHNAAEFVRRHLGRGFERHFMRPYNEKLFTVPLEELSPEWGGRFIPRPGLRELILGAVGGAAGGAGYNATFWYPRQGGIEAMVRGLEADVRPLCSELRTGARLAAIDLQARTLRFSTAAGSEVRPFDAAVLTLPLHHAARLLVSPPPEVAQAAALLRAVSVTVVELGGPDAGGERFHWAYFPEPRFPFYRVGSPSQVNPALAPPGCRSFAVEFAHRGPVEHARLIAQSIEALSSLGLLDPARLDVRRARTIETAYVLFDQQHARARQAVLDHLAAANVQVAGRYGNWEYSSMEDALLSGRDAARRLLPARRT